jgi:hypothetical protein
MEEKNLKYEFTGNEVNWLLNILNRIQVAGIDQAKELLFMTEKLQKPLNASELEKEQYEKLKEKFNKDKKEDNKK